MKVVADIPLMKNEWIIGMEPFKKELFVITSLDRLFILDDEFEIKEIIDINYAT